MIISICQALVLQSSRDFEDNCLNENFNIEYLNDALWKASRFSFDAEIIDPINEKITTMAEQIIKMKSYIKNSLFKLGNDHVNKTIDYILKNGTEGDKQVTIFDEYGFTGLKDYLMTDVDYNYTNME